MLFLREQIQKLRDSQPIPAQRPAPELRRTAGLGIGPGHPLALIPSMVQEPGGLILHMPPHQPLLMQHSFTQAGFAIDIGIFQGEYSGHIEAIQPHLVRVFVLVPVSAFRGPVQRQQQMAQLIGSNPVLRLAGPRMQREQQQSGLNRIQLVAGKIQIAVLIHQIIDILLNIFDISFLLDGFPQ
ncbi:hypothetical protein D3C75_973540 [compost metagenome]